MDRQWITNFCFSGSLDIFQGWSISNQILCDKLFFCQRIMMYLYTNAWSRISPILTSLLSQRMQFSLNCKKIIALKIAHKIVVFFAKSHPSPTSLKKSSGILMTMKAPIELEFTQSAWFFFRISRSGYPWMDWGLKFSTPKWKNNVTAALEITSGKIVLTKKSPGWNMCPSSRLTIRRSRTSFMESGLKKLVNPSSCALPREIFTYRRMSAYWMHNNNSRIKSFFKLKLN